MPIQNSTVSSSATRPDYDILRKLRHHRSWQLRIQLNGAHATRLSHRQGRRTGRGRSGDWKAGKLGRFLRPTRALSTSVRCFSKGSHCRSGFETSMIDNSPEAHTSTQNRYLILKAIKLPRYLRSSSSFAGDDSNLFAWRSDARISRAFSLIDIESWRQVVA
jgi:hypothetical protein